MKTINEIENKLKELQEEVEQLKSKEVLYEHPEKFGWHYAHKCPAFIFEHGYFYYNNINNTYIVANGNVFSENKYAKITCEEFDKIEVGQWYVNIMDDDMPVLAISEEIGIHYLSDDKLKRINFIELIDEGIQYKLKFE